MDSCLGLYDDRGVGDGRDLKVDLKIFKLRNSTFGEKEALRRHKYVNIMEARRRGELLMPECCFFGLLFFSHLAQSWTFPAFVIVHALTVGSTDHSYLLPT